MSQARLTFEDLGHHLSVIAVLAPLEMDAEACRGNLEAAACIGRASFDALSDYQEHAYATTRAVQLADLILDSGESRAAEPFVDFAEANAIDGDVLVQFLSRSMRARLLARAGDFDAAESSARAAIAIAALTDVLRDRARAHLALAEVLGLAGRAAESAVERDLAVGLLQAKGAEALVPLARAQRNARSTRGEPEQLPSRSAT
jgi:ATP/maltotriose-dependent transcriptional regulator MalT